MTSKGDFYAPPNEQQYQQGGVAYKEQQDYEILEAGLVPNINAGGRSGAVDLEKQLRLGEQYSSVARGPCVFTKELRTQGGQLNVSNFPNRLANLRFSFPFLSTPGI